jgi:hypothetical protein
MRLAYKGYIYSSILIAKTSLLKHLKVFHS